jgi:hypothetical protein
MLSFSCERQINTGMSYLKRAEIISGVGVAATCLLGILMALLLPLYSQNVSVYQGGQLVGRVQQNVWFMQELDTSRAAGILGMLGVLAVAVAVAALFHASHRLPVDLAALWGTTLLLVATVYVTSRWTSYLFLPSALLATCSAVVATIHQVASFRPRKPTPPDPSA